MDDFSTRPTRPIDITWVTPDADQRSRANCRYGTDGAFIFEEHTDPETGRRTYRRVLCARILATVDFVDPSNRVWEPVNELGCPLEL